MIVDFSSGPCSLFGGISTIGASCLYAGMDDSSSGSPGFSCVLGKQCSGICGKVVYGLNTLLDASWYRVDSRLVTIDGPWNASRVNQVS